MKKIFSKKLYILCADDNKISSIDSNFSKHKKIKKIFLYNNQFRTLSYISEKIISICSFRNNNLCQKGKELVDNHKIKELIEFYSTSPLDLAIQYNNDSKSLTDDEKERLVWEAGIKERTILELNSKIDDKISLEISKKSVVELPTGYKLLL